MPEYVFAALDINQTLLEPGTENMGGGERKAAINLQIEMLDRLCSSYCVVPFIVTQRSAAEMLDPESPLHPYLNITWHVNENKKPPVKAQIALCEMGAVILRLSADGQYSYEVTDHFKKYVSGTRKKIEKAVKSEFKDLFNSKLLKFEKGKLVGIGIELDNDRIPELRRYFNAKDKQEIKEKIRSRLKKNKALKKSKCWRQADIVISGEDIDIENSDIAKSGKLYAYIAFIKEILANPDHAEYREAIEKYGSKVFGMADDKAYAAFLAMRKIEREKGVIVLPASADETLTNYFGRRGKRGIQAARRSFEGLMEALRDRIAIWKISLKQDLDSQLSKLRESSPETSCLINIGEKTRTVYANSVIRRDMLVNENLQLTDFSNVESLFEILDVIRENPLKYCNSTLTITVNNDKDFAKLAHYLHMLSAIYKGYYTTNVHPRFSILIAKTKSESGLYDEFMLKEIEPDLMYLTGRSASRYDEPSNSYKVFIHSRDTENIDYEYISDMDMSTERQCVRELHRMLQLPKDQKLYD